MKKNFILSLLLLFLGEAVFATTYQSNGSGNWATSSTWSPSGVPVAGDIVTIRNGHVITVAANAACTTLNINNDAGVTAGTSTLIINNGYTLTVSGNITQNMTVSALSTGGTLLRVLGTLTCQGNFTQNHTLIGLLGNANTLEIGNSSNSGVLNVLGNLTLQNGMITALGTANSIDLRNGTLDLNGNLTFSAGVLNLLASNVLNANDNSSYSAKVKRVYFGGNMSGNNSGTLSLADSNGDSDYIFTWDGSAVQYLITQNATYKSLAISNAAEVELTANLTNTNVLGSVNIKNGGILNTKAYNLDGINAVAGQIIIEAGGTLKVENSAGVPAQKVSGNYVCVPNAGGKINYYTAGSLVVFDEDFDYTQVVLSGSGVKTYSTNASRLIDNSNIKVHSILLSEGTFTIPASKKLQLSASGSKMLTAANATNLLIQGDFTQLDSYFTLNLGSTVWYQANAAQTVYAFTTNGTTPSPYGNLKLARESGSGAHARNILSSVNIPVLGKVEMGADITLNINQAASLELLSNATNTAYITTIPSSATVAYNGTPPGRIIANRYISIPDQNYRDFTSPIKNTTLDSWRIAGMLMTGFTGSDYPAFSFINAYQYDETTTGDLDQGWLGATNVTDPAQQLNGSNEIVKGGWRIYAGDESAIDFTLRDEGEIRKGTVPFNCSFTHNTDDRTVDDGWNFLGNPFPSPVSWDAVYADTDNSTAFGANGIQATYYVWKPYDVGNPVNDEDNYGFYNAATSIGNNLNGVIPSFQGFWVKTYHSSSNSANYVLNIEEGHKYNDGLSTFHKGGADPRLTLVQINLNSQGHSDKIWFHPFANATDNEDQIFDVPRLGSNAGNPTINFVYNEEPLNLWVNAIADDAQSTVLPLYIKTPEGGEFTLAFSNLEGFTQGFGCIKLLDHLTNQIIDLNNVNSYSFSSDPNFEGIRFTLSITKTIARDITFSDATCFEKQDGFLHVDFAKYAGLKDFSLYKGNELIKRYSGQLTSIHENLPAGSYQLVNNSGQITCSNPDYLFVVGSLPQILANFVSPTVVKQGETITFTNLSNHATHFEWFFTDDQDYTENQNATHTFNIPGVYDVVLRAYNAFDCSPAEQSRQITVTSTTAIDEASAKQDILAEKDGDNWVFTFPQMASMIQIISMDGKIIKSYPTPSDRIYYRPTGTSQILILQVVTKSDSYSIRFKE